MTTTSQSHMTNLDKNMKSVSLINGYWFYFEVDGLDIAANGSTYSGKEIIYINDNPVSEKRNLFSTQGTHEFQHQGKEYKVTFNITNILTGELVSKLYVDGKLQDEQTKAYVQGGLKGFLKTFLYFVLLGAGIGVIVGLLISFLAG